jgi:hypothetical protein
MRTVMRMRPLRFLLHLLAAMLAATLTVGAIVLLSPALQREAALTLLRQDTERRYQVESLRLHFGGIEAAGLYILSGQGGLAIDQLSLQYPPWRLLFQRTLAVRAGQINGLHIDLAAVPAATDDTLVAYLGRASAAEKNQWLRAQTQRCIDLLAASGPGISLRDVDVRGTLQLRHTVIDLDFRILTANSHDPDNLAVELYALAPQTEPDVPTP